MQARLFTSPKSRLLGVANETDRGGGGAIGIRLIEEKYIGHTHGYEKGQTNEFK